MEKMQGPLVAPTPSLSLVSGQHCSGQGISLLPSLQGTSVGDLGAFGKVNGWISSHKAVTMHYTTVCRRTQICTFSSHSSLSPSLVQWPT